MFSNPTKQQRQVYKACVLGRIYGMGAEALARNLGISKAEAQRILDQMTARYPALNAWLERIQIKVAHAIPIVCLLGWSLAATGRPGEERTFLNFPMQANSAELMRLIIVRASHLPLIGCAHDSFLVEDAIDRIEQTVAELREIIRKASRDLLGGFELRADYDPTKDCARYPDRFADEREREDGMRRWNRLMALIEEDDHGCGAEKVRRIRSGSAKRERAQQLVVQAPNVLGDIMLDASASPKHRIDSAKALDAFAANGPESRAGGGSIRDSQ